MPAGPAPADGWVMYAMVLEKVGAADRLPLLPHAALMALLYRAERARPAAG